MISERRKRFCERYLFHGDGNKAAIEAGFSAKYARNFASRLLTFDDVKAYLAELRAQHSALFLKKMEMDAEYLKGKIKPIIEADIRDYVEVDENGLLKFKGFDKLTPDQSSAIESMKMGRYGLEFKLHGKSWSMDMIAKHLGFYEGDNAQKQALNTGVVILPSNGREIVPPDAPNEAGQ